MNAVLREPSVLRVPPHSIEPLRHRFMALVEKTSGCWLWRGSVPVAGDGYGFFGHSWRAHRASFVLFVGPIPPRMMVCHVCDNRICVNPRHLFLGTSSDNNKDRARKGRSRSLHGERSPNAKLTQLEAEQIRGLYADGGILQRELGIKFGVSQAVISKIILRQGYAK